ncbi:hypothetical protein HZA39_04315 [Candidatus Peregrinibacteria bacterium]|nr:hypothetical protein [Candidatus Peregrinibacteria bacterium]
MSEKSSLSQDSKTPPEEHSSEIDPREFLERDFFNELPRLLQELDSNTQLKDSDVEIVKVLKQIEIETRKPSNQKDAERMNALLGQLVNLILDGDKDATEDDLVTQEEIKSSITLWFQGLKQTLKKPSSEVKPGKSANEDLYGTERISLDGG